MKCVRQGCENRFEPEYKRHICCSQGCWTAILHVEIGKSAAGMRPFGFMGDHKKIKAARLKYERLARAAFLGRQGSPASKATAGQLRARA